MFRACVLAVAMFASAEALAWLPQPVPPGGSSDAVTEVKPPLSAAELEQLAAPIALYPDSLVSQILMASTYPLEVVVAARWARDNTDVKGDALAAVLNEKNWDASVKSLVDFPDVLTMMSEQIEWTTKLGDAFIAQQKDLLAAVQTLRGRASDAGNLKPTEQQAVEFKQEGETKVIVIESTNPEVIYVPRYDPVVVYGDWPYPAYPPYRYYWPGYAWGSPGISWGLGFGFGVSWGWAWGGCNWYGGYVDYDCHRHSHYNHHIDHSRIENDLHSRGFEGQGPWRHDGEHRRGVSYRDNATAQKFGRGTDARARDAREQYRGRAETGRQDIARGGADQFRGAGGPRPSGQGGPRPTGAGTQPQQAGGQGPIQRPSGGGAQGPTTKGGQPTNVPGAQQRPTGAGGKPTGGPTAQPPGGGGTQRPAQAGGQKPIVPSTQQRPSGGGVQRPAPTGGQPTVRPGVAPSGGGGAVQPRQAGGQPPIVRPSGQTSRPSGVVTQRPGGTSSSVVSGSGRSGTAMRQASGRGSVSRSAASGPRSSGGGGGRPSGGQPVGGGNRGGRR